MGKYDVLQGEFACHVCKQTVYSIRWYYQDKLISWMCKSKHVSEVNLDIKRKKVYSDGEIGE